MKIQKNKNRAKFSNPLGSSSNFNESGETENSGVPLLTIFAFVKLCYLVSCRSLNTLSTSNAMFLIVKEFQAVCAYL